MDEGVIVGGLAVVLEILRKEFAELLFFGRTFMIAGEIMDRDFDLRQGRLEGVDMDVAGNEDEIGLFRGRQVSDHFEALEEAVKSGAAGFQAFFYAFGTVGVRDDGKAEGLTGKMRFSRRNGILGIEGSNKQGKKDKQS